jgi:hypothetical protein
MAVELTEITRKKLVLIRQLYEQSLRQSSQHTSIMDKIMSVIGFDLAIESALKAAATSLDPTVRTRDLSKDLVQKAEGVFQAKNILFPSRDNLQRIRDIRNDAQHEARYPNDTDLADCRVYARDILNHILFNVWGQTLDKISLADLIQHEQVKQFFVRAEQALNSADYTEAAAQAIGGFQRALGLVRNAFVGKDIRHTGQSKTDFERMIERMRSTILYQSLNISYADTVRLDRHVGEVLVMADDSVNIFREEGMLPIERTMAESTISYCVEAVVRIEQQVGNLSAPFGIEYWW